MGNKVYTVSLAVCEDLTVVGGQPDLGSHLAFECMAVPNPLVTEAQTRVLVLG